MARDALRTAFRAIESIVFLVLDGLIWFLDVFFVPLTILVFTWWVLTTY